MARGKNQGERTGTAMRPPKQAVAWHGQQAARCIQPQPGRPTPETQPAMQLRSALAVNQHPSCSCSLLTLRNQRTPTNASSFRQDTFLAFSFLGCGSGEGTRRAAASARSRALLEEGPTVDREMLPSGPLPPLPPSMVTPPPRPPSEANGLALTLDTSAAADALLPGLLPLASLSAAADSDSLARPASTGSVLMTVCISCAASE